MLAVTLKTTVIVVRDIRSEYKTSTKYSDTSFMRNLNVNGPIYGRLGLLKSLLKSKTFLNQKILVHKKNGLVIL